VSARLVLRQARLFDPSCGLDRVADLFVEDGIIAGIGTGLPHTGARVVAGEGLIAMPGFIDLHVHLREPGQTHKEDIVSGARAAARGGFTAVVAMANTQPAVDGVGAVAAALVRADEARRAGGARVWPAACLTRGLLGEQPTDAVALREAGAVALSDDGRPLGTADVALRALEGAARAGLPVLDHAEEPTLCDAGVAGDGPTARALGLPVRPAAGEACQAARDIALADAAGVRLHLQHLSTAAAVAAVAAAKAAGVAVTAEATPHHLLLTEAELAVAGTAARVNPPLREERDRAAVWQGLVDGVVDAVATDHAPHAAADKAGPIGTASPGISGVETAVALLFEEVRSGRLALAALVDRFAYGPARVLGRPPERLAEGAPAAVTLFAPDRAWVVDPDTFWSRGRSTPFAGRRLGGRPAGILLDKEMCACL